MVDLYYNHYKKWPFAGSLEGVRANKHTDIATYRLYWPICELTKHLWGVVVKKKKKIPCPCQNIFLSSLDAREIFNNKDNTYVSDLLTSYKYVGMPFSILLNLQIH